MYVEKLSNNKYKFVEKYKDEYTGKWRRVSITSDKNTKAIQKEMQLKLLNKIKNKQSNNKYATDIITVNTLCDLFLEEYQKRVAFKTYRTTTSFLNRLREAIGHLATDKLNTVLFNRELLNYKNDGKSTGTIKGYRSVMILLLKFGIKYGYISNRDLLNIELPDLPKKEKNDWKYLEKDELKHVLDCIEDETVKDILTLQVLTGMRISEVLGLSLDELDLENNIIHIKHQAIRTNTVSATKTKEERSIYIDDNCVEIINKYRLHTYYFIFLNKKGNTYTQTYINRKLSEVEFNIDKKITTHIFRHTFITRMVENGVQAEIIAKHVGHTNTDMIARVYSHFTDKMRQSMQNMINSVSIL